MAVDLSQGITTKMYEDALLGFILVDPQKMLETAEILPSADYFTDPDNRAAYEIFLKLFNEDRFPGDPFLTIQELYTGSSKQHFATIDETGRYVNQLLNAPTDSLHFSSRYYRDYAQQIKWEKQRGDLKKMAMDTLAEADKIAYEDREDFIGGIENQLGEITMSVHGKEGLRHISEMTNAISEQIDMLHRGEKLAAGVPTGIDILDRTLNGLKGGEVCVLAARPGCGKLLSLNEDIPTPHGKTKLKDLRVGDIIFDRYGNETKILGIYPSQEPQTVWELHLSDGRSVECDWRHIWPIVKADGSTCNTTIEDMLNEELLVKDSPGVFVPKTSDSIFLPLNSPTQCRVVLSESELEEASYKNAAELMRQLELIAPVSRRKYIEKVAKANIEFPPGLERDAFRSLLFSMGIRNQICDGQLIVEWEDLNAPCVPFAHKRTVAISKAVKTTRKADMACLYVDNDEHLYLCGDYVVTHNTTLSMQIAYNIAKMPPQEGKRNAVLIFSLEMMEDQLVSRMISTIGRVNMQQFMEESMHFVDNHYYRETYSEKFEQMMQEKLLQQYDRTQIALRVIKELPIYPTTESGLSPSSIKSMVMQKKRELERNNERLSLIVIDYLQLMVPNTGKANASRTEEVGDMSRKMKLLAKEFDVPVLLLAQLNRNADVTERPNLKDLRESGSIEQDADKVMFIWSEYADKTMNDFGEYRDDNAKREALRREQQKTIISVSKNRQGECGDCPVIFDKGFQTFVSQSDEYSTSETFAEFAMKYYQKTRTDDIFWPLKPGEIDEDFEAFRKPKMREQNYLTSDGRLLTLADSEDRKTRMMISDAPEPTFPSEHMGSEAPQTQQPKPVPNAPKDRIQPRQPVLIDDLSTGFEEIDDDDDLLPFEEPPTNPTLTQEEKDAAKILDSAIIMDDDEELDMDALDMLEQLSNELDESDD